MPRYVTLCYFGITKYVLLVLFQPSIFRTSAKFLLMVTGNEKHCVGVIYLGIVTISARTAPCS
jgi:hypothetical protein